MEWVIFSYCTDIPFGGAQHHGATDILKPFADPDHNQLPPSPLRLLLTAKLRANTESTTKSLPNSTPSTFFKIGPKTACDRVRANKQTSLIHKTDVFDSVFGKTYTSLSRFPFLLFCLLCFLKCNYDQIFTPWFFGCIPWNSMREWKRRLLFANIRISSKEI